MPDPEQSPQKTIWDPNWYKSQIPQDVAQYESKKLGIQPSELYQKYAGAARANPTPTNTGPGPLVLQGSDVQWPSSESIKMTQALQKLANPDQSQQPAFDSSSYLNSSGGYGTESGQAGYGTPGAAGVVSAIPNTSQVPKGYNLYSPPPVSTIGAVSDLAVQPAAIPSLGSTNLGQLTG